MKLSAKLALASFCLSLITASHALELTSQDITEGKNFSKSHEFNGFGCKGDNVSPMLQWHNIPEGTEYFAVTAYDPDAPTDSGWWHWQMINIPKATHSLLSDAGNSDQSKIPESATQMRNDYGDHSFGGACPPIGDKPHRYQFTVYALPHKLDLPKDASAALVGFMLRASALDSSTLETLYQRESE